MAHVAVIKYAAAVGSSFNTVGIHKLKQEVIK